MHDVMISLGAKLAQNALSRPGYMAITCGDESRTYAELHRRSNRLAHGLAKLGVKQGDLVSIMLPNGVEFVELSFAIWKLGATPQPLSFRLPRVELDAIIDIAKPRLIIDELGGGADLRVVSFAAVEAAGDNESNLPDAIAPVAKAPTSGGSTGRPKVILSGSPGITERVTPEVGDFRLNADSIMVLPGPLYHNAPFLMMMNGISYGAHIILLRRFDAEQTLQVIERHRATWIYLVPTMMSRIWRLDPSIRDSYDLSSLQLAWHTAAPCPPWLKEAFIEWISPAVLIELYTGTEAIACTVITGEEWLSHRGSVGRVVRGEMKIVGEDGRDLPSGEIGEIYMRSGPDAAPTYHYLGADTRSLTGGWQSLGDLGSFDADGFLFLADRRGDMILVGGANVYPAEIEAALEEHSSVQSCIVIGLPDEDLGSRLHAIVQPIGNVAEDDLKSHLAQRLVTYKLPRSYEFISEPLRDEAGKVRRTAFLEARTAS